MGPGEIAAVGVLVVAFAVVSMRIEHWPLTMPMVFVGAGFAAESFGLVDVSADIGAIALLAEITLAVILFSDAVRVDIANVRRFLAIPTRLLTIGLPLTILMGAAVNSLLFPDLPFVQVALLAAILAPTDAALGAAVVEDESVPIRERLALNVESGVNDGLVVPVVAILTAAVLDEVRTTSSWVRFVAEQIGWGVVIGVVVGGAAITALRWASERRWSDARFEQLATFVVPIIALFGASALSGNSFIAAFVAGLTFGSYGGGAAGEHADDGETPLSERLDAFTEDAAQLLGIGAFFVFGNVLLPTVVEELTVVVAVCALLTLTVGRIVPVWISLLGTSLPARARLFVGWFGPRGLASVVFGLLLLEETEAAEELGVVGEELFGVIALTVTASVLLHGASAAPGARAYGRWAQAQPRSDEELEMMEDMADEMAIRSRWSLRR